MTTSVSVCVALLLALQGSFRTHPTDAALTRFPLIAAAAGQAIKAQLDIQSIPANGRSAGAQPIRINAALDSESLSAQGRLGAAGLLAVDTVWIKYHFLGCEGGGEVYAKFVPALSPQVMRAAKLALLRECKTLHP